MEGGSIDWLRGREVVRLRGLLEDVGSWRVLEGDKEEMDRPCASATG